MTPTYEETEVSINVAANSATNTANRRSTSRRPGWIVAIAVLLSAASMIIFGVWAFADSTSFVQYVNYHPNNEHIVRDAGAFQIGIGVTLLAALASSDRLLVALAGFIVASGLHTASHYIDRHVGGHDTDVPLLAIFTVIALIGLVKRWYDLRSLR
jgi:hypothetical protein